MSLFGVTEAKEHALRERMRAAGLREEDLSERFVRSAGPGGQNVNKTATCVHLKHMPTGLAVKVDRERSQGLNRFLARRQLLELYEAQLLGKATPAEERAAKIRKQKQRRARRSRKPSTTTGPGG
jgi:protein subunit release factor B